MLAVLKLGVATLLRVAKCLKRVAKFEKKKKIVQNTANIRDVSSVFTHLEVLRFLEGREIFQTSFWVASQKSLRNP